MVDQTPGGVLWHVRSDDLIQVHMPVVNVSRGRAPVLVLTASRQTGAITARITLDAWPDSVRIKD